MKICMEKKGQFTLKENYVIRMLRVDGVEIYNFSSVLWVLNLLYKYIPSSTLPADKGMQREPEARGHHGRRDPTRSGRGGSGRVPKVLRQCQLTLGVPIF